VTDFPLATQRPTFRAAAATFVPELAAADDGAWERLEATVATDAVHFVYSEVPTLTTEVVRRVLAGAATP
jgi:hypothetical protein